MQSGFIFPFALAALASLAHGENCSTALITSLTSNTEFTACTTGSGVSIVTLTSTPTVAQETSICKTDACLVLLRELLVMNSTDCSIPTTGIQLQSQLIQPLFVACSALTANESDSGSGGSISAGSASSLSLAGSSSSGDIDTTGSSKSTSTEGTSTSPSGKSTDDSKSATSASSSSSTSKNSAATTSSSHASTSTNSTTSKNSSKSSTGGSGSATKSDAALLTQSMAATVVTIVSVALWFA